jgi:hypothetical protein
MPTETSMKLWCLLEPAVVGETDTIGSWWSDRLPRTQRGVFGWNSNRVHPHEGGRN